eukprot:CAMPEP_0203751976 /NCGR_PEP_ID=MMETSP0098-20131031/5963_1 /ASSEMBLY_ACC=CAM_ASM_000208 /TAXON_ID=96639 /ORGANISM=" , Strain NY0313808BC1" /LENGTH=645 /DNA_ID=CAMNT_0050641945 /DNA_START=268 /DNA_END=2202 /DNA_ORIENTATION=+
MNKYQGGPSCEIFSPQGTDPLHRQGVGAKGRVKRAFDKELKGYGLLVDGGPGTKVEFPDQKSRKTLGLTQRYLVVQLCLPVTSDPFSLELTLSDSQRTRRRVVVSTGFRTIVANPLHVQLPLCGGYCPDMDFTETGIGQYLLPRGVWMSLVVDLQDMVSSNFPGIHHRALEAFAISGFCKLRQVFTLKDMPTGLDHKLENCGTHTTRPIPRQHQFPTSVAGGPPPSILYQMCDVQEWVYQTEGEPVDVQYQKRERLPTRNDKGSTHRRNATSSFAGPVDRKVKPSNPALRTRRPGIHRSPALKSARSNFSTPRTGADTPSRSDMDSHGRRTPGSDSYGRRTPTSRGSPETEHKHVLPAILRARSKKQNEAKESYSNQNQCPSDDDDDDDANTSAIMNQREDQDISQHGDVHKQEEEKCVRPEEEYEDQHDVHSEDGHDEAREISAKDEQSLDSTHDNRRENEESAHENSADPEQSFDGAHENSADLEQSFDNGNDRRSERSASFDMHYDTNGTILEPDETLSVDPVEPRLNVSGISLSSSGQLKEMLETERGKLAELEAELDEEEAEFVETDAAEASMCHAPPEKLEESQDILDNEENIPTSPQRTEPEAKDEVGPTGEDGAELDLMYDAILDCYFCPKTNKYYK